MKALCNETKYKCWYEGAGNWSGSWSDVDFDIKLFEAILAHILALETLRVAKVSHYIQA